MTGQLSILVTGGTGLLGSCIVEKLCLEGFRVRVLTRNKIQPSEKVEYFQGDITSEEKVKKAVSGCAGIIHCAGEKTDEAMMEDTNIRGTENLYNVARGKDIPFFCHISSVGVIGRTSSKLVNEQEPCSPMNTYEKTKLTAEKIVEQGLPNGAIVILRPTNIFGVSLLHWYLDLSLTKKFKLWLRNKENAHLVYVEDVASAALFFLNSPPDRECQTYIISSDQEAGNTIGEINSFIRTLTGDIKVKGLYPPLIIPWLVRLLRHGMSNMGNIVYSSDKLFSTGFEMPFGFLNGIQKVYMNSRIE